jgi:tRNA pseudouridine55 synthase
MNSGFLLIDKQPGASSYDVIRHLKKYLEKGAKIGHAGTLDPLATGLLIVGIGREATRELGKMMLQKKTYEAEGILGKTYDTQDTTGKILEEKDFEHITKRQLKKTLKRFKGNITQTPPMYSALKHKGRPLYTLARKGEEIEREPRNVTIYKIKLTSYSSPNFSIRVACSSGTYIRTLIHDIGNELDIGASMSALRRTRIGKYQIKKANIVKELSSVREISSVLLKVDK